MKSLFTLVFIFILHSTWAATYYLSAASGDDTRTAAQAQNPSTPWRSVSKLNAYFGSLQSGDSVLLHSGETFYGSIIVNKSGTSSLPIVISSYGIGSKPVLTSLVTINNWVSKGNGIWESYNANLGAAVSTVLVNDQAQQIGRYPNTDAPNKGYLSFETHVGTTSITDTDLTSDVDWTGAEVVIRSRRWVTDRNLITSHLGNTIYYKASSNYAPSDNFGYFIQNSIKTLDQLGEWYYDPSTKKLSVYFGSNAPSSYTVQATAIDNLIYDYKFNNIVFDNISLKGANASAVYIKYGSNIKINSCDINFSGESGISGYFTTNLKVENCTITNSNNDGIDLGYAGDFASIRNNKILNTSVFAGMGGSGDGKGIAIHSNGSNSIIEHNEVINTGYIGINFNGNETIVKNNYVDSFCMTKDDGGGLYTYTGPSNETKFGRKIIGNIVVNGIGAAEGTYPQAPSAEGIYLDDNSSGIEITDNTIANLAGRGLFLNNARNLVIRNNTFYNNQKQLYFSQYRKIAGAAIRNLNVKNNVFFAKDNTQKVAHFTTEQNDNNLIGVLDSNYYTRPIDDRLTMLNSYVDSLGNRVNETLDLEGWQRKYNKDTASKKTPRQIVNYRLDSLISTNKFPIGTFSTSTRGISATSCSYSINNSGQMEGSYLEIIPSASGSSVFVNVGELKAGAKYILRYTVKGVSIDPMYLGASVRKAVSPYTVLTPVQFRKINLLATDNEIMFSSATNEASAQLVFSPDKQNKYYIDNIRLYEAAGEQANLDDSIRFEYNSTLVSKVVNLDGDYVDAKNNKYSNTITLQPFESAVLIKNDTLKSAPPTVAITNIEDNAEFSSLTPIMLNASAINTKGSVSKVDFYSGTTMLGTDSTSPYSFTWDNVAPGNYTIIAKATNNDLAVAASAPIPLSVYAPPSVSLTSPVATTKYIGPATINISATASAADGKISSVAFYKGTTLLSIDYASPYACSMTNVAPGNYAITAKATDDKGHVNVSTAVSITVQQNVAPSVSLTSPVATTKYIGPATIGISAAASDSDGTIGSVSFYNGQTLLYTDYSSPYTYSLTNVAAGNYTITAKATDDKGFVTVSAPVSVTVQQNVAPSVSLTSPVATTKYIGPATVGISAAASDIDGTIGSVKFYNGETLLYTDYSSPYTYSMTNVAAGNYTITAKATDDKGLISVSAPVSLVILQNIAPSVTLTSLDTTKKYVGPATIAITAAASDLDGTIGSVKFYNGETLLYTDYSSPYTYSITNVAVGGYSITAKATDDKGLVTVSAPVIVTVKQNMPPSVSMTSLDTTNKYIGLATIAISATANDSDGTIANVKFYNGSTLLYTDYTSPFTYTMSNVAAGNATITAKATDDKGLATVSAPIVITVQQNIAPSVSLTSPVATAKYIGPATVSISAVASDVDGTISSVKFYSGTTLLGTDYSSPYTYSLNNVAAGTYTITSRAVDNKGMETISAPVAITVMQNMAPTVVITSPVADVKFTGPLSVTLSAKATDTDGSVSKVDFYNGTTLIASRTYAPYTITWQNVGTGIYNITAKATDNKGGVTTSQSVIVSVVTATLSLKPVINSGSDSTTVEEIKKFDVKVFPNPAINNIHVGIEGLQLGDKKANLSITNMSGIIVKNMSVVLSGRFIEADVTSLTPGMYIVSIASNDVTIRRKFIKE